MLTSSVVQKIDFLFLLIQSISNLPADQIFHLLYNSKMSSFIGIPSSRPFGFWFPESSIKLYTRMVVSKSTTIQKDATNRMGNHHRFLLPFAIQFYDLNSLVLAPFCDSIRRIKLIEDMAAEAAELKRMVLNEVGQGLYRCVHCVVLPPFNMPRIRLHYDNEHPHLKKECSVCYNRFAKRDIEDHLEDYHDIEKKTTMFWVCLRCFDRQEEPNIFYAAAKLKGHNCSVHPNLKFECSGCGNVFGMKSEAKEHCK